VNFFLADGAEAGQEVLHVHLLILPRFENEGFGLRFGPDYGKRSTRPELEAAQIKATMKV
jgi:histidine triad (HIT) family protein